MSSVILDHPTFSASFLIYGNTTLVSTVYRTLPVLDSCWSFVACVWPRCPVPSCTGSFMSR